MIPYLSRTAVLNDIPAIAALMHDAIEVLQTPFLDPAQIVASHTIMGLDTQLIEDATYFVVETSRVEIPGAGRPAIVGCGGWSRRTTMYGGDHTAGRDSLLLDPARDAARIRAMYTSPLHTRRGIGRTILGLCEAAARDAGFRRAELVATLAGEPLYRSAGYESVERFTVAGSVPVLRMARTL